jgi:hypothetical protein
VLTQNEEEGIYIMGTTEPQGTSKRIRIVLCALIVLGVTAAMPASGFAADWTSKAAKAAPAADWTSKTVAPAADWTSRIAPAADWTS